jgi:hypothetical protein
MKSGKLIYYSQSKRTEFVVTQLQQALCEAKTIDIATHAIQAKTTYPFPWKLKTFLDVFPETVAMQPQPIQLLDIDNTHETDFIILAYPVWYLSPARPVTSFLMSEQGKQLFTNKPVITVISCRNMWIQAQEDVKAILNSYNARIITNIVFSDETANYTSLVTTLYWFLTGKNEKYLGIFPKPCFGDKQIKKAQEAGKIICQHLDSKNLNQFILEHKLTQIDPMLMSAESRVKKIFKKFSSFILKAGKNQRKRDIRRRIFATYLTTVLILVIPIVTILFPIVYFFFRQEINNKRDEHLTY